MFRALCAHHQEVKLYYTASGIVTPVGGRPVHRLRESLLHVSSTMCSSSGGQIVLYSIWYHHTCRWPSGAHVERESSTCFEHYVLIIRRSKLYYTASGITTPVGGPPVNLCTGRLPTDCNDTRCCIIQI